jgi:4-hydroxybenzoate polyprenyltransferase
MRDIAAYVLSASLAFCAMYFFGKHAPGWAQLVVNTVLIVGFLAIIIRRDLPLSSLPVIGRHFRKQKQ